MSQAVMFISYKPAKGVSSQDLFAALDTVQKEFISKQKGYISWQILRDGELWADVLTWETMEDAERAMAASEENPANHGFFALLDPESVKMQFFTVAKSY